MHAGRLRDRVVIMNFTTIRMSDGQPVEQWEDGKTIWAEVRGISGRELISAGAEKAEATVRLWVRYRSDISSASRIRVLSGAYKGDVMNVIGPPIPDPTRTQLEILCKQGGEK